MNLSIITTITNPIERQDRWLEALHCYLDVADEVVVVNGGDPITFGDIWPTNSFGVEADLKFIDLAWPYEWNWVELPRHLNAGLEACTGDWVIKMDIDQLFHEKDKDLIREKLEEADRRRYPVATFSKFTVVSPYKAYQKGQMPIAINRNFKNICFGEAVDEETDLCYPILRTNAKKVNDYDLPTGKLVGMRFDTGVRYYNYDYFFKDVEFARREFERFRRAYARFYDKEYYKFDDFLARIKRYKKDGQYDFKLEDHPKYIRAEVERVINGELEVIGGP